MYCCNSPPFINFTLFVRFFFFLPHFQPGHWFGTVCQTEETKIRWQPARRHADRFSHSGLHDQPGQHNAAPDCLQKSIVVFSPSNCDFTFNGSFGFFFQMEQLMDRMQDENTGIPVRTVNKFRAKVPSVFTGISFYFTPVNIHYKPVYDLFLGSDLIMWIMKNLDVDDQGNEIPLCYCLVNI